jgi:lipid A 3-O-deacylase
MRGKAIALVAALGLMALPGSARAASGIIDEVKLGILDHDVAIGGDHKECCVDVNGEVLFVSPNLLHAIWAPRPHLGITGHIGTGNSYGYFGLSWTGDFFRGTFRPADSFFAELGLGLRILFHEEIDLGYRFTPRSNVPFFFDHISDANLTTYNPGLSNMGVRLGYRS